MSRIISKANSYINQFRGWKTNEKLVVFESDDWGSIRTSKQIALNELKKVGVKTDNCHYMTFDSLERKTDIESLFNVLKSFKDVNGNHPIFTFNTIVANPDFKAILDSQFNEYFFEPFTETYKRLRSSDSLDLWHLGIKEKLIYPQFHGREHVNIKRWMNDLKNGRKDTLVGFKHEVFGISGHVVEKKRGSYLAVFDEIGENTEVINNIIDNGVSIFNKTFGYKPLTFIAPNYVWSSNVETSALKNGIISMQGSPTQILPTINENKTKTRSNYIGKTNSEGMGYIIRNVSFEPSSDDKKNWVDSALKQMEIAFSQKRPAIIDTHRVNYIGELNESNRTNGLTLISQLLSKMLKKWPEIKFTNSAELASIIYK